jgi:2-keto-4-pentenoate hydratase/2-oxohepta-3-ene-1,7-dioic acid hydratase in catechol pathway
VKLVMLKASGRTGVLIGDEVLDFAAASPVVPLAGWVPAAMPALLAAGTEGLDLIRRILDRIAGPGELEPRLREAGALTPLAQTRLDAPVRPGIVLSHGRAYGSHLKEMNSKGEEEPHAFMKNVHAIIGPGDPIRLPPQCPDMVDLEGEFSIVFGAPCHNIRAEDAMTTVAGYTLINDVSARNWVESFQRTRDPDLNRMGKQLPGFCPLGPVIVTIDEIADPHDLSLVTALNGTVMQDAHTSDLLWRIPALIEFFARWYPFRPGDVLTTGSPAGVGYGRNPKVFMKTGDTVTVTVKEIGTLSNPVV